MNRRNFVKGAAAMVAGSLAITKYAMAAPAKNVGIQLYTVRNEMEKDAAGTLRKIASIGYTQVESASGSKGHYYGMKPKEFKSILSDLGLSTPSSHILTGMQQPSELALPDSMATMTNNFQWLVDSAAEAGQKYLVCAYLFPSEHQSMDNYKRYAELFNQAGEACKKAGIQFAYHNHDFEFEKFDGQIAYDYLLTHTDPELVKMELDLYWVTKAGFDPVAYFEKYPGRFPLWHVKDMDKTPKQFYTEVGNGSIDFKRIFKKAKVAGMQHYFVEQDECPGSPLDSITTSFTNLKKMKLPA